MGKSALMYPVSFVAALLPSFAYAHTGGAGDFMHGLTHPFGGLDHICAMLAVGLWAAQMGGRLLWIVPLTFVSMMMLGGTLPMLHVSLPFVESGIVLSVLLLGVLITAPIRLPLWLSSSMAGLFALWHGYAHGVEMPVAVSGMAYAVGFVLATAALHAIGIASGLAMRRLTRERAVRFAGVCIALCGVYWSAV